MAFPLLKSMDMFYIETAWPLDMLQMDRVFIPFTGKTLRVDQACNIWTVGNR